MNLVPADDLPGAGFKPGGSVPEDDLPGYKPPQAQKESEPGLIDRAKQGLKSTVAAGKIAATDDPARIAELVAEGERTRLPATAVQQQMARDIEPYKKAYEESKGVDAVGAFASLAAKRLAQFISNPSELAGAVAENLPNAAPGMAGTIAGGAAGAATPIPFAAPVGAVAGGTAGGYFIEQGAAMRDQILKEAQARNIDPRDAAAIEPIIREKYQDFLEKSRLKGAGTAVTDAVLNTVTMGVAGMGERTLAKEARVLTEGVKQGTVNAADGAAQLAQIEARQAARMTLPARAQRGAGIIGAEMAGEGISEAAGQKLAYGQVDPLDVVDESILGLGQGGAMAAGRGVYNRVTGQPTADTVDQSVQRARAALGAAQDAGQAAAGADLMAGNLDNILRQTAEGELAAATTAYLGGQGPTPPAPTAPGRPTLAELRQRVDRETDLREQAAQAGTDFERRMALEQIRDTQPAPAPRTAEQFVDLTPMDPRQAQNRLTVLRDQVAQQGGNALGLAAVAHPSQPGKFAIVQQPMPSLDLQTPAPTVTPAQAQNRIETAALTGKVEQARAEDQNSRQVVIDRALRNVEERGGVASPAEARIFQEAGLGRPYDRIDETLGQNLTTDETLTQATGIPLVGTPREAGSESQRLASLEQANAEGMADFTARAESNRAQRERETQAAIEQTSQVPTAPAVGPVIAALATPGAQRTAEQVAAINQAKQRLSSADFSILERAANAPFRLSQEERLRLRELRNPAAPTQSVAPVQQTRENTDLMGERVRAALGLPSNGAIVTGDIKMSTTRGVPGETVSVTDSGTEHQLTVTDGLAKTPGLTAAIRQFARLFGKRVVFFNSSTLKADGFVRAGNSRDIFINANSQMSPLAVFGHELMHLLKRDNPVAYRAVAAVVARRMDAETRAQFRADYGKGANLEELSSDLMGNAFQDEQFLTEVFQEIEQLAPEGQAKGIISRLAAAINKAIKQALAVIRQLPKDAQGFKADEIVKNLEEIRAALKSALVAYAQQQREPAMRQEVEQARAEAQTDLAAQPETEGVTLSPAQRGGVVQEIGGYRTRQQKDGTLAVIGDPAEIRALLPEGVVGRPVPGGIAFTASAAPRVRAALEGRKLAYSRGGQVTERLPVKNGKYVGAPEKFNTPAKIPTLRRWLRQLADEGAPGRYWYENSSREVLQMVGGNVQEARKFVALLAIYSPQAKVDSNSTFALRAWAQYKAGQPISVKTGVMDRKAQAALDDVDAFWSGEKTGNFFFNLLREIDPSTAGKQGATIDMWMMRAGQYGNDAPTATQYAFMENEINRLAAELGWEPQQVQAAIWVAMKARMENAGVKRRTEATSEKKGWIRYDYPIKNGRPVKTRVILNAKAHRDNWLKHSFAHDPTKDDTQQAKFDFADGLRRHIGQLSWEARPGRSTNVLPGVNDAPYEQQVEFQQAVQKVLLDDNGVDLLAYKLGLLVDGPDILAPGVWQGEIAAGMQKLIGMAPGKGSASAIDPAQKKAVEAYAAMLGLLLRQEGVGYHRPFYNAKKSAENGVDLAIGRALSPAEAQSLWGAIDERMKAAGVQEWENGAGMISSPTGMRVVNFGAIEDNAKFRALVKAAAETLTVDEVELKSFSSDGDLVFNDWKESPNGEDYRSRVREAYGPDLLEWARDVLAPRVQSVFDEFSTRYGWGDPGRVDVLFDQPARAEAAAEGEVDAQPARPDALALNDQAARDDGLKFSPRRKAPPKETVKAYKLFRVDARKPGQLFPLFVDANTPVPVGKWLDADIGEAAKGGKVKSKIGPLAFRPGWHAGDLPIATHIGGKSSPSLTAPDIRPDNHVWAEVEMAADRDWQTEANKRGTNAQGKLVPVKAHITDQVPEDGYYRYKTNANMTGNWLIGGSMKVTRVLSDAEVKRINKKAGVADLPREQPFDAKKYGFDDIKRSAQRRLFTNVEPVTNDAGQLLAPNGQVSNLTEDQWYQVRSPEFKAWFGDWENDPTNASRVVDENGEPKVVYHGTTRGGFTVFNAPGGRQRGDIAIFATDNRDMADSYVKVNRRGEDFQFPARFTVEDLEKRGFFFNRSQEDGTWAIINDYNADIVDVADTIDELLQSETVQDYLANNPSNKMPGIYPVFMNLRDVPEIDAEGANWAELPDGRTTDQVGREAKEAGYDGAIIYNVEDEGGGPSAYAGEPATIYMAFDPNAIKSANSNVGSFSQTDEDIRFSRTRQTDTPEFKQWFGDSVVRDGSSREPMLVYTGTSKDKDFDKFNIPKNGAWFTTDPAGASQYAVENDSKDLKYDPETRNYREVNTAARVIPAYLRIEKPYTLTDADYERINKENYKRAQGQLFDELRTKGYDGVDYGSGIWVVIGDANQIKSAIGNSGEFSRTDKRMQMSRQRIVGDSKRAYTPEQKAYFERVGRTVTTPTLKERIQELRKDLGKKMAQGIADQFRPIKDLSKDAYMLARLSKGATGAFEALLHHGKLSITSDKVYDADQSGGFIERVGVPLRGELEDFLWWVAANRAERLTQEDRENLFTADDIAAGKSLDNGTTEWDYTLQHDTGGKKKGSTTRDRTLIYRDALKTFDEFNKNTLDMAEQSGLIDAESRPFWEHEFYVPFYRVSDAENGGVMGAKIKSGLVRQEAFKRLKGGSQKLNSDLLANTLSNWGHLIDASAKNRAALETLEAARKLGIAIEADEKTVRQMGKSIGKRDGVVSVMDQGKERFYLVDDPMLLTAITSLDYAGLRGPIMDAMSTMKHWLTVGVTASPAFKIRNLVRDSVSAVATAPLSYNIAKNLKEGFQASDRSSQTYVSALASGGLIRFGTMLEGSQAKRTRQLIKMGVKDSTILDSESKVQQMYDKYLEPAIMAYNELGNRGEEINRSALFKQLKDQGMSQGEAALMARDLMDFSMQGSWASIRFLTQVVPFMNARLQGLYKLGRASAEDKARFGAVLGAVAVASIGLMLAYQDDDDWKKREDWDRNNNWWFKIGGVAFRIPKPFEIGSIATLAERGLEYFISPEMTGKRLYKNYKDLFLDSLSMNPTPQLVKPIVDLYANKDSFTGRPIETMGMDRLKPQYRYTQNTSMAARGMSTATGGLLSPVQYDHLIRGYFSWLGSMAITASDAVLRPATGQPARPAPDYWKAATGGILAEVDSASSRYVSQMYDQAKELEQAMGTYRMLMKTGRVEEAREFYRDNKEAINKYGAVEKVKAAETRYNEMIRMIERSSMEPEVKKERIRELQARKDRVARYVAPGAR